MSVIRVSERGKQQFITLAVWLVGLCVAWIVGHWVVNEETHLLIFAALGFVLLVISFVILHN
ncbi:MAG: hypothetical protein WA185_02910, partial [Candidatus Acidiferrales bacterium]